MGLNGGITTSWLDTPGEAPSPLCAPVPASGIGSNKSQCLLRVVRKSEQHRVQGLATAQVRCQLQMLLVLSTNCFNCSSFSCH